MTYLPPLNGGRINATIGGNTAGAGALVSSGTLTLAGGNNVTLSQNGNAITISGAAAPAAASNTLGMSNIGNTSGTTGVVSGSALQFAFAGGNNITLSQSLNASSGTITISAANQSAQTQSNIQALYDGANSISTGTVRLSNANGVSFGINGQTLTASHNALTAQSNQTVGLYALGNTTQNSSTTLDARTLSFNGLGGATIGYSNGSIQMSAPPGLAVANSQTTFSSGTVNLVEGGGAISIATGAGQSIKVSVPQTSSLSGTGAVSISTTGSTISIGVQALTTLSRWEYPTNVFTSLGAAGQGSLSIEHMYAPFNVTGTAMKIGGSISAAVNTSSATTASANFSLWMGIYTLNGSTLSLASSGSANNGFQWSHSGSSTANSSINSMRQMTVPVNVNMTPGEYWVAAVISSATTFTSAGFTIFGNNLVNNAATGAVLTPIGSNTSAARDAILFQGIYTAGTSAGPTTIAGTQINNTSASNVMRANFYNMIFNATY